MVNELVMRYGSVVVGERLEMRFACGERSTFFCSAKSMRRVESSRRKGLPTPRGLARRSRGRARTPPRAQRLTLMPMPTKRANSLCVGAPRPSAMLKTIDSAAPVICDCKGRIAGGRKTPASGPYSYCEVVRVLPHAQAPMILHPERCSQTALASSTFGRSRNRVASPRTVNRQSVTGNQSVNHHLHPTTCCPNLSLSSSTQYFIPPAAAKSSIAFFCSSDSSSGTATLTSTSKSPRATPF